MILCMLVPPHLLRKTLKVTQQSMGCLLFLLMSLPLFVNLISIHFVRVLVNTMRRSLLMMICLSFTLIFANPRRMRLRLFLLRKDLLLFHSLILRILKGCSLTPLRMSLLFTQPILDLLLFRLKTCKPSTSVLRNLLRMMSNVVVPS